MKRAAKTIECFNDIRKYLFEHKVPCLQFIRDGKVEVLYTQMYIDEKDKEIERLNNIINELNNAYCKVITKCEEMINSRFYMNDIAIKKYADEIKDICRYYVGKAKELKGSDSNEIKS